MTTVRKSFSNLIGEEITDPLYYSLLAYNFISGVYIGGAVGVITELKVDLSISDAILGDVEACSFFGIALGIVLTPWLIEMIGSGFSTFAASIFCTLAIMIYGLSSQVGVWLLAISFVLIGFGFVWVTGSFNTQLSI
jgi:hypothetical protein